MTDRQIAAAEPDAVVEYKTILKRVLDNRPSGTRQRLAKALGKNRSFISQISNPAYPVPIPVQHLETMFELCHFSAADRGDFLAAYRRAHPRRLVVVHTSQRTRIVSLAVPDLGDARRNRAVEAMVADFVRRLRKFVDDIE
jgi:hypothetical protein